MHLEKIALFASDIISGMAALVTGGVLIAAIWVWASLTRRDLPKRLVLLILVLAWIVATYQAWLKQEERATALELQLTEIAHSKLTGMITGMLAARTGANGSDALATAAITVLNNGAPSVVTNFVLMIRLKDGRNVVGSTVSLPSPGDRLSLGIEGTELKFVYYGWQSIVLQGIQSPIPRNGAIHGFYQVLFRDVAPQQIREGQLSLSFTDATRKHYRFTPTLDPEMKLPIDIRTLQTLPLK